MISDLGIIFKVYFISLGLQLLMWPWVSKWFKEFADKGWALGRVLGLLSIGLPIWFLGHLLPVNTDLGVGVVILVLVLIGLRKLRLRSTSGEPTSVTPEEKLRMRRMILVEEGLFLLGFLGLSLVRGFQPDILGLEKFMDFGFVKQYLVSVKLPVNDMWLAGEPINYYSFGHFLTSILVRVWGVGLGVGYNLMLAWILGTSLALSFSIVVNLGGGMIGGMMGSLLACLGGNSHAIWYFFKNKGFTSYWYADATRFIENTIHEYPGYSFVVSDLHAHVLGLPVVLAFILVLIGKNTRNWVVLGVLMGVMAMTNTWDVAVYGLLLGVFSLINFKNEYFKKLFLVVGVAGVVAIPWLVNFISFSDGVSVVNSRSPLWQMGVLWGGHLVVTVVALWLVIGKKVKKKNLVVVALGVTAVLLLLIPEVLYVKDIYTSHQRANTMFKLTYQAFIMMSLLFGWVIGRRKRLQIGTFVLVALWGGLMLFPTQAFNSYYGGFKDYKGIDGLAWLRRDNDKWEMVKYLEGNSNGNNLVEAVGDSYSEMNGVSVFSGTPTVVGWRVHEWLWRGGYDVVRERESKVRDFYQTGDKELLEGFNVGWVVVGEDEMREYKVDENSLLELGQEAWRGEESYLIKIIE
jgi:uncharacterized membrane protein